MNEHYEQAEGFGAAVPASWCLLCGCLVNNRMLSIHRMACTPEVIAAIITAGQQIGR